MNGYRTRYAHLSFVAKGMRAGVRVRQGQLVGHVGSSGLATGPHLHYELLRDGVAIDQRRVNLPSGNPVSASERPEFERQRLELAGLLDRASAPMVFRVN